MLKEKFELESNHKDIKIKEQKRRGRPSRISASYKKPTVEDILQEDLKKEGNKKGNGTLKKKFELEDNSEVSEEKVQQQTKRPRRNNSLKHEKPSEDLIQASKVNQHEFTGLSTNDDGTGKKKRGRPKRSTASEQKQSSKDIAEAKETQESNTRVRTRRSNALSSKQIKVNDTSCKKDTRSDTEEENDVEINPQLSRPQRKNTFNTRRKRKVGRPKTKPQKIISDKEYLPHHEYSRLSSEKAKDKSKASKEAEVNSQITITCGKCSIKMKKSQWANHNLKEHNDLGWQEGKPKPDYENDIKLKKKVLFIAHKKKRQKLVCEKCKIIKLSVHGLLSHEFVCGKTEEELNESKIPCPGCQTLIFITSLEYHNKKHALEKIKQETEENQQKEYFSHLDDVNVDHKITKRKAAQKAVSRISEFSAMSKDDMDDKDVKKNHINNPFLRKIVQRPKLTNKVHNTIANKWKKELEKGQNAFCTQPGCHFTCKSFQEITEHYLQCNFTPQKNYVCKICKYQTVEKNEILNHVNQNHRVEDLDDELRLSETSASDESMESEDEINDSSTKGLAKRTVSRQPYPTTNTVKFAFCNSGTIKKSYIYPKAFEWTLDFEQKNYQLQLFEDLKPNTFGFLDRKKSNEFLPELKESMSMKIIKDQSKNSVGDWKKWKRFEGKCIQGTPMFFVGGPVWAMAWLPIPSTVAFSENISQFIAISTHKSMEAEFPIGKIYKGKNIIQVWDVGNLNHRTESKFNPKLAYAIAHEGGTVWSMEWCPSGCYDHDDLPNFIKQKNQIKRMGLLAAGCSDGFIRVYSLIFPEDLPAEDNIRNSKSDPDVEISPVYKTDPVLTLVVNLIMYENKEQSWQVTKLSWTKEKNHNVIVAGFSNGYVGLWDLSSKSPMLKIKKNNRIFLQPYRHFMAHSHAVSMVYLIPQDGQRFLATASLDRKYKFWDLENISNSQSSLQKSFVTDGSWLNNWGCVCLSYDDALSMNHNYVHCVPLRDFTYNHYNVVPMDSPSYTISTSDFGNSMANGTLAGEVLVLFPHQLLYIRDMEKSLPQKRYISLVNSVETCDFHDINMKNEDTNQGADYNFMPSTYNESKDRFGLIFRNKMNSFQENYFKKPAKRKTLTADMMKCVPFEQYPFMSVNKVSWNPNVCSFLWLSVAYQNGFVQLLSFRSLASSAEWNKLLQSHIIELEKLNRRN